MKKIQNKLMSNELFVSTHPELTGPDLNKRSPRFSQKKCVQYAYMSRISKDKEISAMLVEIRIASKENPVRSSCFTRKYIFV
jgi:hypothetical protein